MFVSTKDALSSYYYLIAVDEHVTDEERDMFDAIGNDIDPQMFGNYREELVDGCRNTVNQASLSTDRFEMLVEAVDDALHAVDTDAQDAVSSRLLVWNMGCRNTVNQASLSTDRFEMLVEAVDDALHAVDTDAQDAVSSRLLVWNMISISFADGGASEDELKMIRHVARYCGVDRDVFQEMEQLMRSASAVLNEKRYLESSNGTYAEIKPIIDEMNNCGVDRDVFQEMEQLMRSASAVLNEKRYLESSNGTYAEIKPIIDEMNKRCAAIQRAAEQLIGDELAPKPGKAKMPEKDIVDHAKEKIEEGIAPAANWVQEQAANVADAAGSAAKPVLEQAGSALNSAGHAIEGALNPIGDEVQKQAKNALGVADAAGSAAKPVLEQAGSALNSAGHAIEGALNPIGDEVQKQAKNALGAAKNVFGGLFGKK